MIMLSVLLVATFYRLKDVRSLPFFHLLLEGSFQFVTSVKITLKTAAQRIFFKRATQLSATSVVFLALTNIDCIL